MPEEFFPLLRGTPPRRDLALGFFSGWSKGLGPQAKLGPASQHLLGGLLKYSWGTLATFFFENWGEGKNGISQGLGALLFKIFTEGSQAGSIFFGYSRCQVFAGLIWTLPTPWVPLPTGERSSEKYIFSSRNHFLF